jgi:hypothetical protein
MAGLGPKTTPDGRSEEDSKVALPQADSAMSPRPANQTIHGIRTEQGNTLLSSSYARPSPQSPTADITEDHLHCSDQGRRPSHQLGIDRQTHSVLSSSTSTPIPEDSDAPNIKDQDHEETQPPDDEDRTSTIKRPYVIPLKYRVRCDCTDQCMRHIACTCRQFEVACNPFGRCGCGRDCISRK